MIIMTAIIRAIILCKVSVMYEHYKHLISSVSGSRSCATLVIMMRGDEADDGRDD